MKLASGLGHIDFPITYLPLVEQLEIFIYEHEDDEKQGFFKLPISKIYNHPDKMHNIKISCIWIDK